MSKFYGNVGYAVTVEDPPGVWKEVVKERPYFGDVTRNTRKMTNGEYANSDIEINNTISILSDPYALQTFYAIRYVTWMGTKWKVSNAEVAYPRLILTLGGVYNDEN